MKKLSSNYEIYNIFEITTRIIYKHDRIFNRIQKPITELFMQCFNNVYSPKGFIHYSYCNGKNIWERCYGMPFKHSSLIRGIRVNSLGIITRHNFPLVSGLEYYYHGKSFRLETISKYFISKDKYYEY